MTKSQKKAGKALAKKAANKASSKATKAAKAPAKSAKPMKTFVSKVTPPVKIHMQQAAAKKASSAKPASSKKSASAAAPRDLAAIKQARATAASLIRSARDTADAGSEAICREVACEALATSGGYCRTHYIKNWKKIKRKELILKEGKLNHYIEELVAKYPDKYVEAIRQDLAVDKEFAKVIYDLELDENVEEFDAENQENAEGLVDNMKREFEDETETF